MKKKFVSFISPVYNVNLYLDDFFSSFKSIPRDQYELIIVDDKSPEDPKPIIDKWKECLNIKFIKNDKNLGLGFSRNVALNNLSEKATHFMVIDSDDVLSEKAWDQIVNAKDNLTYVSSKYLIFDTKSKKEKKVWKNQSFVGSGVLSSWGNLVPVSKKEIHFTSRTFEDFRWMAQVTSDGKFDVFKEVIVEYRNRASSIMNTPYNSERRARAMVDQANELIRANREGLIKNKTFFKKELRNLYIIYMYVSKSKRLSINFDKSDLSKMDLFLCNIAIWPQKFLRVWWWYETFRKTNAFK